MELYNESLEYFEAVQAAVKRSERMKNANLSLRERMSALPNETALNSAEDEFNQSHHQRVKRSVIDLASMIKCVTGCNPFMYKDYGCYCGFQGDGYPVDGIDRYVSNCTDGQNLNFCLYFTQMLLHARQLLLRGGLPPGAGLL